jgi:nicotinamide phosphoribosyltransferase
MKNSARGFLRIEKEGDDFIQYDMQTRAEEAKGAMEPVYCDGKILRDDNLSNIRNRLIPSL